MRDTNRVSTSDSTRDSSSTTTGIQNTVSYKDLTGLSPQTIALQNRVYNNTGYTPSQELKNAYGQKQNAENAVANYGAYNSDYYYVVEAVPELKNKNELRIVSAFIGKKRYHKWPV